MAPRHSSKEIARDRLDEPRGERLKTQGDEWADSRFPCDNPLVSEPRNMALARDAASALRIILGIMSDQLVMFGGEDTGWGPRSWRLDDIVRLDNRIEELWPDQTWGMTESDPASATDRDHPARDFELHIEDAELILAGMAFTEMASAEFPWADMVRWTSDFISTEIRTLWSDEIWRSRSGR